MKAEPRTVTTSGTNGSKNHFSSSLRPSALLVARDLAELLARLDAELDALVPEPLAALALVHLRVHVQRREQRVERRRRGVQQERLVEALVLDEALLAADVLVALVDLRGLREARELLVHRLRREQTGRLGPEVLEAHRAVVLEQRVEGVVADPRLVPVHVVAQVADLLEHAAGVVDGAVVGRELDHAEPERALRVAARLVLDERVRADLRAQRRLVEGVPVHGADHPEGVPRRRQVDRDRARLDERAVVDRLVVVAVEEDEIAPLQDRVRHDLVRRGGAVQHEVGLVGSEDLRGVALRVLGRALVDRAGRRDRRRRCTDRCGRCSRRSA